MSLRANISGKAVDASSSGSIRSSSKKDHNPEVSLAYEQDQMKMKSGTSFLEEMKQEFAKMTWTSREELIAYTKIVIASVFLLGLAIYLVDVAIRSLLFGATFLFS